LDFSIGYYRFIGLYKADLYGLDTVSKKPFGNMEDSWPPDTVVVDALTGRGSLYHHGEIYPCTYEECKELVWKK
jgi:hypothetical protein